MTQRPVSVTDLRSMPCRRYHAAAVIEVALDVLCRKDLTRSGDKVVELTTGCRGEFTLIICKGAQAFQRAHQPAAVATRRAMANVLCFYQHHVCIRLFFLQKIGRP